MAPCGGDGQDRRGVAGDISEEGPIDPAATMPSPTTCNNPPSARIKLEPESSSPSSPKKIKIEGSPSTGVQRVFPAMPARFSCADLKVEGQPPDVDVGKDRELKVAPPNPC